MPKPGSTLAQSPEKLTRPLVTTCPQTGRRWSPSSRPQPRALKSEPVGWAWALSASTAPQGTLACAACTVGGCGRAPPSQTGSRLNAKSFPIRALSTLAPGPQLKRSWKPNILENAKGHLRPDQCVPDIPIQFALCATLLSKVSKSHYKNSQKCQ